MKSGSRCQARAAAGICGHQVGLVRPPFVTGDILVVASVSLHALARRIERDDSDLG